MSLREINEQIDRELSMPEPATHPRIWIDEEGKVQSELVPNKAASEELGRLPFGHRSGGLRPELATQSQPSGRSSTIAGASVDLRCLNDNPAPPSPAPWWLRHHQLFAGVACLLILLFVGHAVGEF